MKMEEAQELAARIRSKVAELNELLKEASGKLYIDLGTRSIATLQVIKEQGLEEQELKTLYIQVDAILMPL